METSIKDEDEATATHASLRVDSTQGLRTAGQTVQLDPGSDPQNAATIAAADPPQAPRMPEGANKSAKPRLQPTRVSGRSRSSACSRLEEGMKECWTTVVPPRDKQRITFTCCFCKLIYYPPSSDRRDGSEINIPDADDRRLYVHRVGRVDYISTL